MHFILNKKEKRRGFSVLFSLLYRKIAFHSSPSLFFPCKNKYVTAKIATKANPASNPGGAGVGVDVGPGEGLDVGVGVTDGDGVGVEVMFTAGVGVGVTVDVSVTLHIHVCIFDNPVVVLVAIAETFQVPTTALVFVYAASVTLLFV